MRSISGKRVAIALSGGIDSSVSAYLLKRQGYQVHGVYMRNWDERDEVGHCSSDNDWTDVQRVCATLKIPCTTVNFCKEYWINVFEPMTQAYAHGKTPNPDVACNVYIKFGALWDWVFHKNQFDFLATGHYARLKLLSNRIALLKGHDDKKDQSYYLCQVPREKFLKSLFPVGDMNKEEVKKIAKSADLDFLLAKDESTGLCFIGERKFPDFIAEYTHNIPGRFINLDTAEKIGYHRGITAYTIGQRARIAGRKEKYYVAKKETVSNSIYVVNTLSHPALKANAVALKNIYLSCPIEAVKAKVRYRSSSVSALLRRNILSFENPQVALAEGQVVALYDDDVCVGGGVIDVVHTK